MTRLEIYQEGATAPLVPHLPADISFELIRENPLFNRRGDYTYDIEISLKDPHNRAIYEHIERLNVTAHPKGRRARLSFAGHTVCEGTEVVLQKDEDSVKIQILAGTSELNLLTADENLRIREMDFGTIPTPTVTKAQEVATQIYPQTNYVFPVIYKNADYGFDNEVSYSLGDTPYYNQTELWPQPFLLYFVEKFVELLGYTMGHNALRSYPKWCRLLLISGYHTLEYARMLPDWSAAEFLTNIEKFFNCVFVVNPISRQVDIREIHDWYAGQQPVIVEAEDVIGKFLREYDTDEDDFHNNYRNVAYALPSGEYWKYTSLDKEVERHCEHLTMRPTEAALLGDVNWKIFKDPDYGFQFIRFRETSQSGTSAYSKMVNQFAPYVSDASADYTELKIIPSEIHLEYIPVHQDADAPEMFPTYGYILCARPVFYEKADNTDFKKAILDGFSDNAGDIIQVAFYAGMIGARIPYGDGTYYWEGYKRPMCFAQRYYLEYGFMTLTEAEVPGFATMTMELNGTHGQALVNYNTSVYVDTTQKHTISFKSMDEKNPTDLYIIAGRRFVCRQIKYTYADGLRHPMAEGVFYPFNMK